MEKVYIIGAGARGRLAYQIFSEGGVEVQGFISSEPKGTTVEGVPVVCSIDEFVEGYLTGKVDALFLGIGDNYERFQIHNRIKHFNIPYLNCIHSNVTLPKYLTLGTGIYIGEYVVFQNNILIGDNAHIEAASLIGHDCIIQDFVNIGPAVLLCGAVKVDSLGVVGARATILEKRYVGQKTLVAAGAVVSKDIECELVVGGIPAKFIKKRDFSKSYLK